jgi:hypothetical protein
MSHPPVASQQQRQQQQQHYPSSDDACLLISCIDAQYVTSHNLYTVHQLAGSAMLAASRQNPQLRTLT